MIFDVYGYPVYKGKFSKGEDVLRYIEECKIGPSDKWNAKCLVSSSDGSSQVNDESMQVFNDIIFNEIVEHGKKMLEELDINVKMSPSECGHIKCTECQDIWINKYVKGHSQDLHWHLNPEKDILFSFTYFAKYDPKKDARFVFVNAMPREFRDEEINKHKAFTIQMIPEIEEGDIIIFPCWLLHYVETQKTDNERITMAGNFFKLKEY